jgi:hypothetical protein
MQAIEHARRAAREPIVGGYFLGGFIAGAASAFTGIIAIVGDTEWSPGHLTGPAAAIVVSHQAKRSNVPLPASLEASIAGADSAYVEVFRRTYDETLRRRRTGVAGIGALIGVMGTVVFLATGNWTR